MHKNLKFLLPTPIWEAAIGDELQNDQLEAAIYEIEQNENQFEFKQYPFGYTNYSSGKNVGKDPRFKPLVNKIFAEARQFLTEMQMKEPQAYYLSLMTMFCTINRKYSRHMPHLHGRADLCGVYYVNAPKGSANFVAHSPMG